MHVQKFLRENSLEELEKQFKIKIKVYENFVGLNYSQLDSPKNHPIVVECRSLKLVKDTWEIASRAFDRFFNYGENGDESFDFNSPNTVIMEKSDGSIIPIWYNKIDARWEISSKSNIFGEIFRDKVLSALNINEEKFQTIFNEFSDINYTYIFEYIGPDNTIVTPYSKKELVLLGIRNNNHPYNYFSLEDMENFLESISLKQMRLFKIYKFDDINNLKNSFQSFKNMEEGYVCWDTKTNKRIKIKSPQYVKLHQLKGKNEDITKEDILHIVLSGEIDEVKLYLPYLKERLESAKNIVERTILEMKNVYSNIKDIDSQKEFAKEALQYKNFSQILFSCRKNKTDIETEISKLSIGGKVKLFL